MALKTSIVLQFDGNGALTGLRKVGEATGKVGSKVDAAAGKVDNFDKQNLRLNKTLGRVAHQMAGYFAIFAGGRQILSAVNALGAMDNRLRLVTSSAAELEQVKERIFAIGQASRSSALSVGQLYARVAVASGELGRSQEDLLKLTELTTKAVALSGATASESSAGLIQFAQGLASNRLQGDELRSVLENLGACRRTAPTVGGFGGGAPATGGFNAEYVCAAGAVAPRVCCRRHCALHRHRLAQIEQTMTVNAVNTRRVLVGRGGKQQSQHRLHRHVEKTTF